MFLRTKQYHLLLGLKKKQNNLEDFLRHFYATVSALKRIPWKLEKPFITHRDYRSRVQAREGKTIIISKTDFSFQVSYLTMKHTNYINTYIYFHILFQTVKFPNLSIDSSSTVDSCFEIWITHGIWRCGILINGNFLSETINASLH